MALYRGAHLPRRFSSSRSPGDPSWGSFGIASTISLSGLRALPRCRIASGSGLCQRRSARRHAARRRQGAGGPRRLTARCGTTSGALPWRWPGPPSSRPRRRVGFARADACLDTWGPGLGVLLTPHFVSHIYTLSISTPLHRPGLKTLGPQEHRKREEEADRRAQADGPGRERRRGRAHVSRRPHRGEVPR